MDNNQIDLFGLAAEDEARMVDLELYFEWCELPILTDIAADDPERKNVCSLLRGKWKLYQRAQHFCPDMPKNVNVWLNEIEPTEFWVMNKDGEVCGEKVDVCPFCGADLKNGAGDVTLIKANSDYWIHAGFIEEGARR